MSNPYISQAENAIRAAEASPQPFEAFSTNRLATDISPLARFDDNETARFNSPNAPREVTGIYVPPRGECLYLAYDAIDKILGRRLLDRGLVDSIVEHESQHRDVARQLGITQGEFGIALTKYIKPDGEGAWGAQASFNGIDYRATKLAVALICAYPSEPSPGDISDVQAMGYEGVEDVARRVHDHNKAMKVYQSSLYPIPLSARAA